MTKYKYYFKKPRSEKELGFYPLQKSVWVHPYQCQDEIELLREFFGLSSKEIRLITAENIENDDFLYF